MLNPKKILDKNVRVSRSPGHTHSSKSYAAVSNIRNMKSSNSGPCRTLDMTIFGIFAFFLQKEVALSVRGRSNRLGHPRFACARGMYFRRFARRFLPIENPLRFGNVTTAWGARSRISEGPKQEGIRRRLCCAWDLTSQTTRLACILHASRL